MVSNARLSQFFTAYLCIENSANARKQPRKVILNLTLNQRVAGSSPSQPIGCQTHAIGTFLVSLEISKRMCAMVFFYHKNCKQT